MTGLDGVRPHNGAAAHPASLPLSSTSAAAPRAHQGHESRPASLHVDVGRGASNSCPRPGSLSPVSAVSIKQQQKQLSPTSPAARQSGCRVEDFAFPASPSSSISEGMPPLGSAFPAGRVLGAHLPRYTAGLACSSSTTSSSSKSLQNWSSSNSSTSWASRSSRSSSTKLSICSVQMGAADVPEPLGSSHWPACHEESLAHWSVRSPVATATAPPQAHQHYGEDAEVAAITLSGGRQQQQHLPLLHHLEAILGQEQRSTCRSTPPVLLGGSSNCCTPNASRRSCSALELAAIAEGYIQPALSPSAAAAAGQQLPSRHPSTSAIFNTSSSMQQHRQPLEHAAEGNTRQQQQQHAQRSPSALLLPPRVQISSKDLKQRLLVEPPSSPQLLPHTQGRSATLLSAVHDSSGGLDLDPETPTLLSPAAHAAENHAGWGAAAAVAGSSAPASPGAARLAAIGTQEAHTAAVAAAAHADLAGQQVYTTAAAAAALHSRSPLVVVLPPTGSQPNSHGTERWRAAVDDATNAGAAIVAGLGSRQGSCNSPVPVAAGDDRGRHMQDGRGRLRGVHVEAPDNSSTAPGMAGTGDAEPAKRQLQQQRSRSSSVVTNSRSSQGRRGTCRSLSRGAGQTPAAAGSSRNCTGSCDMHAAVPAAGTHHGSGRASASELSLAGGGVRRSSGGGGRAREPAGPLELDPCAPPLNSIKLSQPVLADVDYIVHRWSHRWQCDRQRQAATAASPPTASAAAAAGAHAPCDAAAAAAAAAASKAEWVRSPEQLHLFGASPVNGLAGTRQSRLP